MRKGEEAALGLAPAASLVAAFLAEEVAERRTDLAAKEAIFGIEGDELVSTGEVEKGLCWGFRF